MMAKKFIETVGAIGLFCIILIVVSGLGCSREEAPPSQQEKSAPASQQPPPPAAKAPASPQQQPATPVPQAQPPAVQAPAPAPAAPQAAAGPHNYKQIQMGMTSAQVRQLMGMPDKIKEEKEKIQWEYETPQGEFEVELVGDKVASIKNP